MNLLAVTVAVLATVPATLIPTRCSAEPPQPARADAVAASFEQPADDNAERRKHPLWPALQMATESLDWIDANVKDYTCDMVRRERIGDQLRPYEHGQMKIRHEQREGDKVTVPFSVYLSFNKPAAVAGREALFVQGEHGDRMFAKRGGQRLNQLSGYVKPNSASAMRESRYPITDAGFRNMMQQLIDRIEQDFAHGEVEVNFFKNAKVGDRLCTRIEVVHPVKRDHFDYHKAMVFVDDELHLPIGFASFTWPEQTGGQPVLLEEYVFTNVKLNVGLTDADFDRENPAYGFNRYSAPEEKRTENK